MRIQFCAYVSAAKVFDRSVDCLWLESVMCLSPLLCHTATMSHILVSTSISDRNMVLQTTSGNIIGSTLSADVFARYACVLSSFHTIIDFLCFQL